MIYPKNFNDFFSNEVKKLYFCHLLKEYNNIKKHHKLLPSEDKIFMCFNYFDIDKLKVVILGQDPYPNANYANGLAFAVNQNCNIPRSLQNIFKEIQNEYGKVNTDKTLLSWVKQGVLLLNTSLCVVENEPNSCSQLGWSIFIKNFIEYCNKNISNIVYLLWGKNAQSFKGFINDNDNLILTSGHPSPYSCKLFLGNNHFIKCNQYLKTHNKKEITW